MQTFDQILNFLVGPKFGVQTLTMSDADHYFKIHHGYQR